MRHVCLFFLWRFWREMKKVLSLFGSFTFIHLLCNRSLAEISLSSGIEGGNLYIGKAYLTLCA